MKRIALALACLAAMAVASPAAAATPTTDEAHALGAQAYDYGIPLMEYLRIRREETSVRCPDKAGNAPVNSFSNADMFARPQDRTVVAPNTDTLYSIAHVDLSKGPIVLSHPAMGKRFYDFELVDPWTNVLGYAGTRTTGQAAGKLAIVWTKAKGKAVTPKGAKVVRSDYRRVWVIGRTLASGKADQAKAYNLMKQYRLANTKGKSRTFPKGCKPGDPKTYPTPTDGAVFMARLNNSMADNPPPARDDPFLAELAPFGVGPGMKLGSSTLPVDVRVAFYQGATDEAAALPTKAKLMALSGATANGGWFTPAANTGKYGTDYTYRAMLASAGIGANTPEEATYPLALTDSTGSLLSGANKYRVTFAPGEAPPAKYFWSLTMYDLTGYLTENSINRYSVGPSHPPLAKKPDGSIVIAVQHDPPTESGVNWLPAPETGFRLNMRIYGPSKSVLNGGWKPPPVTLLP